MIAKEFTLGLLVLYWSGTSFAQNSSEPAAELDSITTTSLHISGSGSGYFTLPPEVTDLYVNSPKPLIGRALGAFIYKEYVEILDKGIINNFLCLEEVLSSCKKRCGQSRIYDPLRVKSHGLVRCHCDPMCVIYNDCCPDYLVWCLEEDRDKNEQESKNDQTAHVTSVSGSAGQTSCIKPGEKYGFVAVDICPSDWTDDQVSIACSCKNCTDVMSLIPVYESSTKVIYKNIHCARCHNAKNTTYFLMEGECKPKLPGYSTNISKEISVEDILRTIPNKTTELFEYFNSFCKWEFLPHSDMQPETCVPFYASCIGNDSLWKNISLLCDSYSMAVCYKDKNDILRWYRNPHCALCSNRSLEEILCFCAETGLPSPQKMSVDLRSPHFIRIVLDEGNLEKRVYYREKCREDETFDIILEKCVNLFPPEDILKVICNGNFTCVEVREKHLNQEFTTKVPDDPQANPTPTKITKVIQTSGSLPDSYGKEGRFYCKGNFSCAGFDNESKLVSTRPVGELSTEGPSVSPEPNITCYKLKYNVDEDDVVQLPDNSVVIISQGKLFSDSAYFRKGGSTFICPKHPFEPYPVAQQGNPIKSPTVLIFGIRQRVFSCVFLFLSALALGNVLGIFLTVSKQRTIPGKIAMNTTGALFMSHIMLFVGAQCDHMEACRIIACFQHYFLLSSYFWISVMALDSSKVLAAHAVTCKASTELMELTTEPSRIQKRKYNSSSSNEHAMVASVESIRKSSSRVTIQQSSASALLYGYAAYAWGTPLFVVATAMALDFSEVAEILYGKIYFCWIRNGRSSLLIFDAPVSIILLYNLETLVRTIMTLRRLDEESCIRSPRILRSEVWFYLKLTGLMAAIWICGLLFWITKLPEIGYPFVIINTFLGFYVFHVIVIKKYIRSMCRDNVLESLQKRDPRVARRLQVRTEMQTTSV